MYTFTCLSLILCSAIYGTSGESCLLKGTSRYSWVVKIWKPASAKVVGHGALLSEDKVLSSCNAYAKLSPDLGNERYEMVVHDFGGVDRQVPFCTDSRLATAIMIHPKCDPSSASQLHDFAMWHLESPFQVVGKPFLLSLHPAKNVIEIHVNETRSHEGCQLVYAKDPTKKDLFGTAQFVGRCKFQDYATLEICQSKNCTQQLVDGLLCFYKQKRSASDSWMARQPLETPDFVEGSVVLCFGHPLGIASRTFYSNDYAAYRMFSNLADNLDFLNTTWTPPTTISTTQMTSPATSHTPSITTTTDSGRSPITTTKITTPINCKCPNYNGSLDHFNGQISMHGDHLRYILTDLGILAILRILGRTQ